MKYRFSILLTALLLLNLLPLAAPAHVRAGSAAQENTWRKVIVDASDPAALQAAADAGGEQMVDYGSYSLWRLPESVGTMSAPQERLQPLDDAIHLRDITLTSLDSSFQSSARKSVPDSGPEEGLWLVQFIGPPLPEWLDALKSAGAEIVSYVPSNAYLMWSRQPAAAVERATAALPQGIVEYSAHYLPEYRLAPALRGLDTGPASSPVDVAVQIYTTPQTADTIATLQGKSLAVLQPPEQVLNTTVARVTVSANALAEISAWADVVNIEPYSPPELLDEIQGQILAGNLTRAQLSVLPGSPGYLDWLRRKGFPTDPGSYPLVDLMDDGLDSGDVNNVLHPDFYVLGSKENASRIAYMKNCTSDPSGNGIAGHGNLNAGILAGYNNRSGTLYRDRQGYQFGLGISPYGPIASTKLFKNNRTFSVERCYNGDEYWAFPFAPVSAAYAAGARITSNSWGRQTYNEYDVTAQTYDILTRDAAPTPGNQEMLHIFAAGNLGPDRRSISSPGTAKNIITVGATENVRADGVMDGCNVTSGGSANNIADFSSRGPTWGGRIKPEIVAPGTHVQGPVSQASGYTGIGVCGANDPEGDGLYYPSGQTLYTWSSGTSHAAPAIAGVAQLTYNYYQRVMRPGKTPSPAMVKALILNTPRYLQGTYAGDTLPSDDQGWGSADMSAMFDSTPRTLVDQETAFTRSGEMAILQDQVYATSRPVHVTLAWTDAPGSPVAGQALVNDLDLEVTAGGVTYRGNVFYQDASVPGGSADRSNNVESVFLPAGVKGPIEVRVIARSISGDGVPGNDSPIDQDFALVMYNTMSGQAAAQPYNFYAPSVFELGGPSTP